MRGPKCNTLAELPGKTNSMNYRFVPTHERVVSILNVTPLHGWGIRLLSDLEKAGWKEGAWLSKWTITKEEINAAFSVGDATLVFTEKADAEGAADLTAPEEDLFHERVAA